MVSVSKRVVTTCKEECFLFIFDAVEKCKPKRALSKELGQPRGMI